MAKKTESKAGSRPSLALGTWKNPGASGAYSQASTRGLSVTAGGRKKGKKGK